MQNAVCCIRLRRSMFVGCIIVLLMLLFTYRWTITINTRQFSRGQPLKSTSENGGVLRFNEKKNSFHQNNVVKPTPITKVIEPSSRKIIELAQKTHRITKTEFYSKRLTKVNPFQHKLLINARDTCEETPNIMIIVCSAINNLGRRDAIRTTWGKAAREATWPPNNRLPMKAKLVFALGMSFKAEKMEAINAESRKYGDIIQGNFNDSYRNLTLKSLLILKWTIDFCPGSDVLMKCDDDMIINLPFLYSVFANRTLRRSMVGHLYIGAPVLRSGKWALPDYPFKIYPPYLAGPSYIITSDIVGELLATAQYVPSIFIEDVYITGILGKIIGVTHVNQDGFCESGSLAPKMCDIVLNKVMTGTAMTSRELRALWTKIPTTNCRPRLRGD